MLKRVVPLLALAALAAGCAHEVESPTVKVETLTPDLLCNAQRVGDVAESAPVVIAGSGFTPLPTNVLAEPPELILPSVHLVHAADLAGAAASGTKTTFSGDPDGDLAGNLSWQSAKQMTFRVTATDPAVLLEPGLYDVTVTNPDGKRKDRRERGLAVVPPPSITAVAPVPPALCTAQEQRQLILTGENFLVVAGTLPTVTFGGGAATGDAGAGGITLTPSAASGCQAIPGSYAGGTVELCTELTVDLPIDQSALPPGTYQVVVTSPAPASCESSEPTTVVIVPPPLVDRVEPAAICVDQSDQTVTVHGGSFAKVGAEQPTVTVAARGPGGTTKEYAPTALDGCAPPAGTDAAFGVELCDTITFVIPAGDLPAGDYTLSVTNPAPVGCTSSEEIDLTVNAPPRVDSVAPAQVCSGGSVLVATGEGFLAGARAELRCGSAAPLASVASDVSADGTTATLTFGAGAVPGVTCDLVLVNADGCEDRPLPHKTVVGTEGPILFNVAPDTVYQGISTKVLLYVTALEPPFTARMWPSGDSAAAIDLEASLAPGKQRVIQVTIPEGRAAGDYDVQVSDQSGCLAVLDHALTVTEELAVETGQVTPPFGKTDESVPVTIVLGSPVDAVGAPQVFLNPPGSEPAIPLLSVTPIDDTTLTAVIPEGTAAGVYDLVMVWADGRVAVLTDAYTAVTAAPPVVADVVPQSIVNQGGQSIEVRGTGFVGSSVSLRCASGATLNATAGAPTCAAGSCTQTATVDGSTLGAGEVCVVRVTNGDATFGEFSAMGVTNSSLNLAAPVAGRPMATARRALVASAVKASSAARFLYAIGGDDGQVSGAFASVEIAPVDVFGRMSDWSNSVSSLGTRRTFAASATVGRYVYVYGGNDGSGVVASAERALVLSPEEIAEFSGIDLCLAGGSADCFGQTGTAGLEAGAYAYRVAAVIDPADPVNLGGEILASDPIVMKLRSVAGRTVVVQLTWDPPRDSLGAELSGITGYRLYRTPKDGVPGADEVLLAELSGAATRTYLDDGSDALGTDRPRRLGSTSDWRAIPALATAREGAAGAAARDPADPTRWYVYSLLGRNGGTGHASYEYLPVVIAPNGRQTVSGGWTTGAQTSAAPRFQHGAWVVDSVVSSAVSGGDSWIYLGAGLQADGNTTDDRVEAGLVAAGGELGAFADDPTAGDVVKDFSSVRVGYGVAAAAGSLFVFGGSTGVGAPRSNATAAKFTNQAPGLTNNSWNNEGLSMTSPRYLMGSTIQSAFIFLVGGDTGAGPTTSSETVVW